MTSQQFLLVLLDGLRFGLKLENVEELLRALAITPIPHAPDIILGVINIRGEVIPVIDFRSRCGLPRKELLLSDIFVIALSGKVRFAFSVDSALTIAEIPMTMLGQDREVCPGLSFQTELATADGELIIVKDLAIFLSQKEQYDVAAALSAYRRREAIGGTTL